MKIGVFIPCYILDDYLQEVIEFYKHWDKILVIEKSFKEHGQVNVRNEGLAKLRDCDYVWTVDADEIILQEEQDQLLKQVVDGKNDSAFIKVIDYASGSAIYEPSEQRKDHKPVVLVNPNAVRFYDTRCIRHNKPLFTDNFNLHHLGFIFPEKKIEWKMDNYWNTGNPKEASQIMNRPRIQYDTPKIIKQVIRKVENVDIERNG